MRQARRDPGPGGPQAPAREPASLGVGARIAETAPAAAVQPIRSAAPTRDKTILGTGLVPNPPSLPEPRAPWAAPPLTPERPPPARGWDAPPPRALGVALEKSAPLDLVAKKPMPLAQLRTEERRGPLDPSLPTVRVPRRRGRQWLGLLLVLVSLAMGVGGAYPFRSRIPWQRLRSFATSTIARGHTLVARLAHR